MYLLDTNVVSELRKAKAGKADPRVTFGRTGAGVPCSSTPCTANTLLARSIPMYR